MNHDDWASRLTQSRQSENSLDAGSKDWQEFLKETETAREASVSDWHVQVTQSSYSDFLRSQRQLEAAARLETQIGDEAESSLRYWRDVAIGSIAQSSLDYFELGNTEVASKLAQRALRLLDTADGASGVDDDLIKRLRVRLASESAGT